jgi:signal transduction histidine kinase
MAKTTVVLGAAMVSLLALDSWRFQQAARVDVDSLASMTADNIRAALAFEDGPALASTLGALRMRPEVQMACAYRADGQLVSAFARDERLPCPDQQPAPPSGLVLGALAPVQQNERVIGHLYIERDWTWLQDRLVTAGFASLVVLLLASIAMLLVSHRLHRTISEPIGQLAGAAREIGLGERADLSAIRAPPDEVGELVTAFRAMIERVQIANAEREALLQREQDVNRMKDEFLATVSHELRTPLSAIVGWSRILATANPDSATAAKAAASVHRNAQLQARMIDDLIDISRIVTGKLRVLTEPLDLRVSVESAVEAIRASAELAGLTLRLHLPASPCLIKGDRDRLQQIVWNLLSNAVKFAPGGEVDVTLVDAGDHLELSVVDNGIGIAPEFIDKVFDRFRQADASVTREHGGLGIGLAVVKELVELHGGSIRAESGGRGKGARFTASFPCYEGDIVVKPLEEGTPSLAGISVLAVDDNSDALQILEASLTQAGASVRTASSGDQAIAMWREASADVLLCDLAMPHMSGFQVLWGIRDLDRESGRVTPAIAVTAHATDEQIARSAQAGFQMHITKPFDANRLIRTVSAVRARV